MFCRNCQREIPDNSLFCNWCGEKQIRERKKRDEIKVPTPRQLPSGSWFIQLRAEGQSITEPTKELCIARAKAIRAGFVEKQEKQPKLTLDEAVDKYIEKRKDILSPSTIRSYKIFRRIRFQDLMDKRLDKLTADMVQNSINIALHPPKKEGEKEIRPLSPKTIHDMVGTLKSVLKEAKCTLDLSGLVLPMVQMQTRTVLTPEEIKVLFKGIHESPVEVQILLALWLGLRRSEIIALEKKDFDFEHGTVKISKALVKDADNKLVEKGTKTAKSARIVSCPKYIMDMVKDLPDGKIYKNDPGYILKCLHRICDENGLPSSRLHDLRHVNASIMLMLNTPDKYAMERGGWSSKQTMTGRYQHTYSTEAKNVDDRINNYFSELLIGKKNGEIANGVANSSEK